MTLQPPAHPCRRMPTRHCPVVYEGACGDDRACARYESEDETPWLPELPPRAGLTDAEHEAMDVTADLANRMSRIIGNGPSRQGDVSEMVHNIHALQHTILAQAAARAYPDRYRLLGEVIPAADMTGKETTR